jgi:hypothetical protein
VETVKRVRTVWPASLPLAMRISASDWIDGGWDIDQTVELAKKLGPLGVDLFDRSSGGIAPGVRYDTRTAYQVPFAERVLKEAGLPTAAVGSITEPKIAEEILQKGQATLILLARAMLDDPYWPLHGSFQLGGRSEISLPPPYEYVLQNPVIAAQGLARSRGSDLVQDPHVQTARWPRALFRWMEAALLALPRYRLPRRGVQGRPCTGRG